MSAVRSPTQRLVFRRPPALSLPGVAAQARDHAGLRPDCAACGGGCHVKDWRLRQIATLFGGVTVRLPRFLCAGCGRTETGVSWPSHCRSTPELGQLRAHLSALMPYRVAAGVLQHLLPVETGSPETLRGHTLKAGEQLRDAAAVKPAPAVSAVTVTVDSTFIRSCHDGERHLEVRVGNVETPGGARQVFGAVARTDTNIAVLIRRNLETVGRTDATELTAFTDGCPGLPWVRLQRMQIPSEWPEPTVGSHPVHTIRKTPTASTYSPGADHTRTSRGNRIRVSWFTSGLTGARPCRPRHRAPPSI